MASGQTLNQPGKFPNKISRPPMSRHSRNRTNISYNQCRNFSFLAKLCQHQPIHNEPFHIRMRMAFRRPKFNSYLIPAGAGICFLGLAQVYKNHNEKKVREESLSRNSCSESAFDVSNRIIKKEKTRPTGPWQVQIMASLPLKALSRLWGRFNELEIPYHLRVPGFKLYSYIFGVDLSEISEPDLHSYPNLASFFYRTLKPGVRPLDTNTNALLSPADGTVLQYGLIAGDEVEQVKGITYSLDALLGSYSESGSPAENLSSRKATLRDDFKTEISSSHERNNPDNISRNEETVNFFGISFTLSNIFSGPKKPPLTKPEDASTIPKAASEAKVREHLSLGKRSWNSKLSSENRTALYYIVVYLAPGDYHRFHSPCEWIVESRRHFVGELFSVSPYLQRLLPGLFTLNERVVLLGRWRWGFFSFVPVGATNVGSIKINFDRELQTNSHMINTSSLAAIEAASNNETYLKFSEATYEAACPALHGHPLRRGEEMGGFQLGSTIVLVFEAAKGQRPSLDQGWMGEKTKRIGGWRWAVEKGQKIRMGQALGWVDES